MDTSTVCFDYNPLKAFSVILADVLEKFHIQTPSDAENVLKSFYNDFERYLWKYVPGTLDDVIGNWIVHVAWKAEPILNLHVDKVSKGMRVELHGVLVKQIHDMLLEWAASFSTGE